MTKEFEKAITWAPTIDLFVLEKLSGIDPFKCEFMQLQPNDSYVSLDITEEAIADLCEELEDIKGIRGELEDLTEGYMCRLENDIRMREFLRAQFDDVSVQEVLVSVCW
jgi:hypothetical protein